MQLVNISLQHPHTIVSVISYFDLDTSSLLCTKFILICTTAVQELMPSKRESLWMSQARNVKEMVMSLCSHAAIPSSGLLF